MSREEIERIESRMYAKLPITAEELAVIQEFWCNEINAQVYCAALLCEHAEHLGLIHGNGHHMAQDIGKYAESVLRARFLPIGGK